MKYSTLEFSGPFVWSLFETVQGFVELINKILIREKVTWYFFNINFLEGSIEKGGFNVEMVNVEL